MPDDNKVNQKITDRSAEEFSQSIESGELYEELKNKNRNKEDKNDGDGSEKKIANK